jgi:hypothetical protein
MTDRWHRFRLEIAGQEVHGLAFDSEASLEAFLGDRGIGLAVNTSTGRRHIPEEPRAAGRPSFDIMIAAAVTDLQVKSADRGDRSALALRILRHLAKTHSAEELPGTRAVTNYLRDNLAGKKYGKNSKRARIRRIGGRNA